MQAIIVNILVNFEIDGYKKLSWLCIVLFSAKERFNRS